MLGYFFQWVCWLLLTLIVFFNLNIYNRTLHICWILLLIITFPIYVSLVQLEWSLAFFILLCGATVLYVQQDMTMNGIFMTFTLMMCYISLRVWEVMAPIWFFMPSHLLIPILMTCFIFLFWDNVYEKMSYSLFSLSYGELFYSFIINSYFLHTEFVSSVFFDYVAVTILILVTVHLVYFIYISIRSHLMIRFK